MYCLSCVGGNGNPLTFDSENENAPLSSSLSLAAQHPTNNRKKMRVLYSIISVNTIDKLVQPSGHLPDQS